MLISVLYLTVSRTLNRTVSPREMNHRGNAGLKLYYSAVQIVNRYSAPNCKPEKETQQIIVIVIIIIKCTMSFERRLH